MNRLLSTATGFMFLSLAPQGIATYEFLYSGGVGWIMLWQNELAVWSGIFSVFAMLAVYIAYMNKKTSPMQSSVIAMVSLIIIVVSLHSVVMKGGKPSSKGDSSELELLAFWSSGWWK